MLIDISLTCDIRYDRNKVMSLCTLYLTQDITMLSKIINFSTIKHYLTAVSSVLLNRNQLDLLLDSHSLKYQCINNVFSKVKLWESMPNHKNSSP